MDNRIYLFDDTKVSKTKDTTYSFKELSTLNPKLLQEIFESNNKYRLTEEAIKSVYKIRDSKIKQNILKLDNERKSYINRSNTSSDVISSDNLKEGDYQKMSTSYILYGVRTGI